jgi:hypothetical protein
MRKILVTVAFCALLPKVGFGQEASAPNQGTPPTELNERSGFWTANNAPPNSESFEVHVVQNGDTLWGLAEQFLGNPFMWPQLWETNEHIINPHWIYPEDQILIRPLTQITEEAAPGAVAEAVPEPEAEPAPEASDEVVQAPRQPVQLPNLTPDLGSATTTTTAFELPEARSTSTVKPTDLYCSGFITTRDVSDSLSVLSKAPGTSTEGLYAVRGDYVYLSQGSDAGVQPGDMYTAVRPTLEMDSPQDRGPRLGRHYLEIGQLETVTVQQDFAMARVVNSCDAISSGDTLVAFTPIDFPELPSDRQISPTFSSTGNTAGAIVGSQAVLLLMHPALGASTGLAGNGSSRLAALSSGMSAEGDIVYIDLGEQNGVRSGDLFLIYRPLNLNDRFSTLDRDAIRRLSNQMEVIGELVVIKVEERAATALITFASDGVSRGDLIELR